MANDASLVPFWLKQDQLKQNGIDLTQVQFYMNQKLILRRMSGNDKEVVKGGTLVKENSHVAANEVVIPAMTPVVCDRVVGDSLMISFETSSNDIPFAALNGSNVYTVLAGNWINGSADVTYDKQTYRIICGSCSNVAEAKLLVKETSVDKGSNANKTVTGRKLYK